MKICTMQAAFERLGFGQAYNAHFKMKDGNTGTEKIFCNSISGVIAYVASLKDDVQSARLFAEVKNCLREELFDECYYPEGNNVIHGMIYLKIDNNTKGEELSDLLKKYLDKMGKTSSPWTVTPKNGFIDFDSPWEAQWDYDYDEPGKRTNLKIRFASTELQRILNFNAN